MSKEPLLILPMAGITSKVARGSLWTLGGYSVTLLASLIATPLTIRLLGTEAYGVLALINVLVGYLAFADLGMGLASTQFAAEAHSRGDDVTEVGVIWTALAISLVPSLFIALTLFLNSRWLVERVIRLPLHLQGPATVAFQWIAVGIVARTVSGVLNTPQLVRLRMDLATIISSGTGFLQISFLPIVLFFNGGLKGAAALITGMSIVVAVTNLIVSGGLQPMLLRPKFNPSLIRPIVHFGGGVIFVSLAGVVTANTEKLLLPRLVSVSQLAHYSVAYTLAGLLLTVPSALAGTLIPAFSRLQASTDHSPLKQLYATAVRGNLFWVVPAAFLLCGLARPFITLWAGPEYGRESTLPTYILVVGLVFNVMAYVPICCLMAMRKAYLVAGCYFAELVPYIFCSFVLIQRYGANGAALAWSIRAIFEAVLLSLLARRVSNITVLPLKQNRLDYAIALLFLAAGFAVVVLNSLSFPKTVLTIGLSLAAYAWMIWRRVLMIEERTWLWQLFLFPRRFAFGGQK